MNRLPKGDSQMLILTEKPSVAKDFANALNCSFKFVPQYKIGYYSDGRTDITNHLFSLVEPDFYDDRFKSWKEIPCIPERFIYQKNSLVMGQILFVLELLTKHISDSILIATDADREGEVIARECLSEVEGLLTAYTKSSKIKRFWVSQALTKDVILEGIKNAKPLAESYCT